MENVKGVQNNNAVNQGANTSSPGTMAPSVGKNSSQVQRQVVPGKIVMGQQNPAPQGSQGAISMPEKSGSKWWVWLLVALGIIIIVLALALFL